MEEDWVSTNHLICKSNRHFTIAVKHPLHDNERSAHKLKRIIKEWLQIGRKKVPKILDTPRDS